MVLQNIVLLQPGIPARMHFDDDHIEKRTITDPTTGRPASRNVLVFHVTELNGAPVDSTFSTMAEKLATKLDPYRAGKRYTDYDFIITMTGQGYLTSYSLQVVPRPK
jgi:hypothetical protein